MAPWRSGSLMRMAKRFMEASPVLFGGEFNLFAHAVAYDLPHGSQTLVDRQVDSIPNGPDELHRFHLHLNGGSRDGLRPWLSAWASMLAAAPAVQRLRLHLPEPYDNAHPAPPSPFVARAFKETTVLAPHRWLTRRHVQRARELLAQTTMELADIALACGSVDQSHFSRVFARTEKQSPDRWRRQLAS